jgi:hypothetical protein
MATHSIREITGHPLYADRKGRVWGVIELSTGRIIATAARKTAAKGYLSKLEVKKDV